MKREMYLEDEDKCADVTVGDSADFQNKSPVCHWIMVSYFVDNKGNS